MKLCRVGACMLCWTEWKYGGIAGQTEQCSKTLQLYRFRTLFRLPHYMQPYERVQWVAWLQLDLVGRCNRPHQPTQLDFLRSAKQKSSKTGACLESRAGRVHVVNSPLPNEHNTTVSQLNAYTVCLYWWRIPPKYWSTVLAYETTLLCNTSFSFPPCSKSQAKSQLIDNVAYTVSYRSHQRLVFCIHASSSAV